MKPQALFYFFSLVFTILGIGFVERLQNQSHRNVSSTLRSTRKNKIMLDSIVLKGLKAQSSNKARLLEKELF